MTMSAEMMSERTVLRGGYGVFWAPYQYAFPG